MDGGGVQGLVHAGGDVDFARLPAPADGDPGQVLHLLADGGLEAGHGDAHIPQQLGDQAGLVAQQGQQQMGLLNLLVAVLGGQALGGLHRLQRFLGIFLRVHVASHPFSWARGARLFP